MRDSCHGADASTLIERFCMETRLTDPVEIAITVMRHPSVAMHGPEHHFLVPARKRAEGVRGGSCGMCGNCGVGVGTGIFVSLLTGAKPLSKQEWQLSNRMTAHSLLAIDEHGGPRCCKRNTFLALQTAQAFLKSAFDTEMAIQSPIRCTFNALNKECLRTECPFYA